MMISANMNTKLNEQITAEFHAAHSYLAMACVFDRLGLRVLRDRFTEQYREECNHAMKILRYVQEVGGHAVLEGIPKPRGDYPSVEAIVATAVQNEIEISRRINGIVDLADTERDYATRSFLEWFIDEQVEEVSSMTDLLNLVKLGGENLLQIELRVQQLMAQEAKKG